MSGPAKRPHADRKIPYHLGVAIGLSTTAYALSMTVVTGLQIEHDRALIEDRRPVEDAIAMLGAHHERIAAQLEEALKRYESGSQDYEAISARLREVRAQIERLGLSVESIEGMAGLLPSQLRLPAIPSTIVPRAPAPVAAPPPTNAKTGASGGK